jgi:hypothetical protein
MSDEYITEQKELAEHQEQNDEDEVFDKNVSKKIIWLPMDFSIQGLYAMKKDGDLDPSPPWQRKYVFDKTKASRLIESVLLDVPIPAVYLSEEEDGSFSVIDGQQRLSTFFFFMDNQFPAGEGMTEFRLGGLQILNELNKLRYSDLGKPLKLKIKNTPIHVIIIKKDSDDDVKFDIFERLNTGSMKLNEDELRNSVYRGPYIDLLDELSNDSTFEKLVRKPNFKNRMLYRGMILRFFALSEKNIQFYRPSMKQYCNKELRNWRNMPKDKADEYRKRFRQSVDLCFSVFGENAFRRFNPGKSEADRDGSWVASRINMALFDVQMCGFVMYDHSRVNGHYDEIREAMLDLMCNDREFSDAIELKTSGREQMGARFKKWLDTLDSITKSSPPSPRNFSYAVKEQLFKDDPTCKLCGNSIMAIEDAEVDHIEPYSQGGPTTLGNAQLAHRYCNRRKSDKTA